MSISESRKRHIWLFMRKNFKIVKHFSRKLRAKKEVSLVQGHITRSVLPARMPLPRFYRLASSWMQGTADSRSSRKFLCDTNYNQGWFKRETNFFL